ncbi:MAG: GNAT family N-acetyltransferase [Actinomycetota bacterium]|nr:GNAT family N-acetyltransferase [Actinomycetota bacterium]
MVRLRAVEEDDLPTINKLFWDPDVTQYLDVVWPEPLAETREWWERARSQATALFAIETLPGELIGACELAGIDGRVRSGLVGIWIGKPFWGRGFGTDAVRTLARFGFREMNLQRIRLLVQETNPRAKAAYENVGFKEEGRLRRASFIGGRHVDLIEMGLLAEHLLEE